MSENKYKASGGRRGQAAMLNTLENLIKINF